MRSIYKAPSKISKVAQSDIGSICKFFQQKVNGSGKSAIGFISSTAGEGTSTVLLQLALSLVRSGKSVLMLDAVPDSGLTMILRNQSKKNDSGQVTQETVHNGIVHGTGLEGLSLIPAPDIQSGKLTVEKLSELIEENRSQADFLLIDYPPVLAPDSEFELYGVSDGLVYVVAAHRTRRELLQQAKTKLQQSGIDNVIGSVLNRRKYFVPGFLYPLF